MIRFIDLFAGTGGIRLGLEAAAKSLGIETKCVLSSDIDKKCHETYELNFGEKQHGDIRTIRDVEPFDFLIGGFPCQPFSYAGKQRGFGDTRGTLFFEIERLLKDYAPGGFLLENVRGLTTHDGGKTFRSIIEHLEALGYGVEYRVLNASSHGVPQNRTRVYVLGLKGRKPVLTLTSDYGATDSHHFKTAKHQQSIFGTGDIKMVKDILENNVDEKYFCSEAFTEQLSKAVGGDFEKLHGMRLIDYRGGNSLHSWEIGQRGECTEEEVAFMNALIKNRRLKKFGIEQDGKRLSLDDIKTFFRNPNVDKIAGSLEKKGYIKQVDGKYNPVAGNMSFEVFKFLDPESVSITLVSSDAERLGVVQNSRPRKITPREAARIQGYPDSYKIHPVDTVAYRQFGNAVAVPVVEKVLTDFLANNKLETKKALETITRLKTAKKLKALSIADAQPA
jgi:DNA (cytosine-5)-methyltransferase 1